MGNAVLLVNICEFTQFFNACILHISVYSFIRKFIVDLLSVSNGMLLVL